MIQSQDIIQYFPSHDPCNRTWVSLEEMIIDSFIEILDILHRHLELRNQLTYHNVEPILQDCIKEWIRQKMSRMEYDDVTNRHVRTMVHALTFILKSDFLLSNLNTQRGHKK